jgi:hypothetical protein
MSHVPTVVLITHTVLPAAAFASPLTAHCTPVHSQSFGPWSSTVSVFARAQVLAAMHTTVTARPWP